MPEVGQPENEPRLEGWKQIASYLGVTERTAQLWEKDGLPVHREERHRRSAVFAYANEIVVWREKRTDATGAAPPTSALAPVNSQNPQRLIVAGVLAAVSVAVFAVFRRMDVAAPARELPLGRILVRSTSEGRSPTRIALVHRPRFLAISGDGEYLFAAHGRALSVIDTDRNSIRTLSLPFDAQSLAASANGKLYVSSNADGIVVVDGPSARLLPGVIATGGRVYDMAITPDGRKLFLAMEYSGLKRLTTATGAVDPVSDRICPEHLGMDRRGGRLYVAYQCSGPGGRPGHDSVGVFDVTQEVLLGLISGPPMVGGPPKVSPDGRLVLLDGTHACEDPHYDHKGCPSIPSHVLHLYSPQDDRVVSTFTFEDTVHGFVDNERLLMAGRSVSVLSAAKLTAFERWSPGERLQQPGFWDRARRRFFIGYEASQAILVLEAETPECSALPPGLAMFYPADGSADDATGITQLTIHGTTGFAPGKVGQAFRFDGGGFLSESWTGGYGFVSQDSTLTMYVKPAGQDRDSTLLEWTREDPHLGIRLRVSADGHFVFESWPDGSVIASKTRATPGLWYHVAVARTDSQQTLFLNGQPEATGASSPRYTYDSVRSFALGARLHGEAAFRGLVDEVAFYRRALTAAEISAVYQLRESGPCKL